MLNYDVCVRKNMTGAAIAETLAGRAGHAVFGPYEPITAGDYKVAFRIAPVDLGDRPDETLAATVDVCLDYGREVLAQRQVTVGDLREGRTRFVEVFALPRKAIVEFRIWVSGEVVLHLDEYCPWGLTSDDDVDLTFPAVNASSPGALISHQERLRFLFERGFRVTVRAGDLILKRDGINFHVCDADDMNLLEEIFLEQVYRFERAEPTVVIDVGMNIGLVAMQFSRNPAVEKIYSFEPFVSTYERAVANLGLNPSLTGKIVPVNVGVSNKEGELTINVYDNAVSGSQSTIGLDQEGGTPVRLDMQAASTVLRQVRARHPGRDIMMKVDCEGSEFGIFEDLAAQGLLSEVSVFMVEWHNVFPGKNQADLIAPLRHAGFTVIDRSPKYGNGFFYAVR